MNNTIASLLKLWCINEGSIFDIVMSQNKILIITPLLPFSCNSNYDPNEPNSIDCTKFVQELNTLFINLKIENCFCGIHKAIHNTIQYNLLSNTQKRSHYSITFYERSGYLRNSYVYLQSKKYFLMKKELQKDS